MGSGDVGAKAIGETEIALCFRDSDSSCDREAVDDGPPERLVGG